MINGAHASLYSRESGKDLAFLRDVLKLPHVDIGDGWLIFALPPAEVAVHPTEGDEKPELYLMTDDVSALVATLRQQSGSCSEPAATSWGVTTRVILPGGGTLGIYHLRDAEAERLTRTCVMDRGHGAPGDVARVVALGASNLTRGFQTVVATTRTAWGPDVQVVAALGHGRSYGADSAFLFRRLPSILESGIWQQLESTPAVPTKVLVTDIGNDIVYGYPPEQILAWVDDALTRLALVSDDVVLTDLPMDGIRRLSTARFHAFRSVFFPSCRLSFEALVATAEQVNAGLAALAGAHHVRFQHLRPSWYGLDPIHIRPSLWRTAWQEILGISCPVPRSRIEALRLYAMRPERQWLFGIEQRTAQAGTRLRGGGRVWLY